jgi:hypothetical protein
LLAKHEMAKRSNPALSKPVIRTTSSQTVFLSRTKAQRIPSSAKSYGSPIGGKQGERALPGTLPEWKHVDANAAFWAVRHFSKTEATNWAMLLPSCRVGHSTDEKPIGLTFSFSPGQSNVATIDYLSGDEDYLRYIQSELFSQSEPGVAEMRMQYSEAQSGVLEGSYNLDEMESARYFVFVLEALLGHPIFV